MRCAKSRVSCDWCHKSGGCEIHDAYKELENIIERIKNPKAGVARPLPAILREGKMNQQKPKTPPATEPKHNPSHKGDGYGSRETPCMAAYKVGCSLPHARLLGSAGNVRVRDEKGR